MKKIYLISLLLLFLYCIPFTSLAQEEEEEVIPSDLVLPKPEILKIENNDVLGFTPESYSIILQMYAAYQLYIDIKMEQDEIAYHYETELKLCSERLELKDEAIWIMVEDREFIYKTTKEMMENFDKQEKRNKIRTILFTTGGVLSGIGIGIIAGFFITR